MLHFRSKMAAVELVKLIALFERGMCNHLSKAIFWHVAWRIDSCLIFIIHKRANIQNSRYRGSLHSAQCYQVSCDTLFSFVYDVRLIGQCGSYTICVDKTIRKQGQTL